MKKTGPLLRKYFPAIYFTLIQAFNRIRKILTPYSIYITDSLGGSFKDYISKPEFETKVTELKKNLDSESVNTIDILLERMIKYPDESYRYKISKHEEIAGGFLSVESKIQKELINRSLKDQQKKYKLLFKHLEESVFYFYHGLSLMSPAIHDYLRNHDFLDIGSFIGDSAVALQKYGYKKIYSVEISHKSISRYLSNMAACNIDRERFEIINACIASEDGAGPVKLADTGSAGLSILRNKGRYDDIYVEQRTVDHIVEKYNISPRYIKVDIEGNGLEFAKGAIKTITRFRPVMSIAIYHNPFEFFEVKPFLENNVRNYNYIIRKLSAGIKNNLCHSDVFLICWPVEIIG